MIIFGKNSDDKGTQFENLSFSLLELLGFTNIVRNDIRGGGAEIDIRAEIKLPFPAMRNVNDINSMAC